MKKTILNVLVVTLCMLMLSSCFRRADNGYNNYDNTGENYGDYGNDGNSNQGGDGSSSSDTLVLERVQDERRHLSESEIDSSYIKIFTAEELKSISKNKNYILMNDIDLGGAEWTPLFPMKDKLDWKLEKCFAGIFDGNGYKISNFKITSPSYANGLFGYISGEIKNLGVTDFSINYTVVGHESAVGGIVGINNGKISCCYASGKINISSGGNAYVGGLVGGNNSKAALISNCYADVNITAHTGGKYAIIYAGGFVGAASEGDITKSYSMGNIEATANGKEATAYAGGFAGIFMRNANITDCFSIGNTFATATEFYGDAYAKKLFACNTNPAFISQLNSYGTYEQETKIIKRGNETNPFDGDFANPDQDSVKSLLTVGFLKNTVKLDQSIWVLKDASFPTLS